MLVANLKVVTKQFFTVANSNISEAVLTGGDGAVLTGGDGAVLTWGRFDCTPFNNGMSRACIHLCCILRNIMNYKIVMVFLVKQNSFSSGKVCILNDFV